MTEHLTPEEESPRLAIPRDDMPITPDELDVIFARGAAASRAVVDMCSGSRRWRMTVPADMEHDHDLVIGSALVDLNRLLTFARAHQRAVSTPPPGRRLILADEELLGQFGTRTEDGRRIIAEWGERRPEGWYEPTFTTHDDEEMAAPRAEGPLDRFVTAAAAVMRTRLYHGARKFGPTSWRDRYYGDTDNLARVRRAVTHLAAARRNSKDPEEWAKRAADVANQAFMYADPERSR